MKLKLVLKLTFLLGSVKKLLFLHLFLTFENNCKK